MKMQAECVRISHIFNFGELMEFGNNNPNKNVEDAVVNNVRQLNLPEGENLVKAIVGIVIILIIVGGSLGSFYKVGTEETAVILRFGKFYGLAQPGLHFKFPFGVDRVVLVKTGRVLKEEFGFRTKSAGVRTSYNKDGFDDESLVLTGDLNVSDLEWIVQFQISDPAKYLFNVNDPVTTIRDISEAVVRTIIGDSNVTDVLTTERSTLAVKIQKELQKTLDSYELGVRIVTVKFQDVNPPEKVKAAFNGVNEAEQQKESMILQAREQYNKMVPKAKGEAKRTLQEAEGYALERVNNSKGEVQKFLAILTEYKRSPEVTRRRLYLETLENVLPRLRETYILDPDGKSSSVLPILPLQDNQNSGALKGNLLGGAQK